MVKKWRGKTPFSGEKNRVVWGKGESDFETACKWWPDLNDIWTPVGWKNHMWRFNVLFNATVIARPDSPFNRDTFYEN